MGSGQQPERSPSWVDVLAKGYFRALVIVDERRLEYEVASIVGRHEVFQRGRHLVARARWDGDLNDEAVLYIDAVLERQCRR